LGRRQLADGYEELRADTAALLQPRASDRTGKAASRLFASTLIALVDGLMIQWLLDPTRAPRPAELAARLEPLLAASPR
jgi:hypothetical protein